MKKQLQSHLSFEKDDKARARAGVIKSCTVETLYNNSHYRQLYPHYPPPGLRNNPAPRIRDPDISIYIQQSLERHYRTGMNYYDPMTLSY